MYFLIHIKAFQPQMSYVYQNSQYFTDIVKKQKYS